MGQRENMSNQHQKLVNQEKKKIQNDKERKVFIEFESAKVIVSLRKAMSVKWWAVVGWVEDQDKPNYGRLN